MRFSILLAFVLGILAIHSPTSIISLCHRSRGDRDRVQAVRSPPMIRRDLDDWVENGQKIVEQPQQLFDQQFGQFIPKDSLFSGLHARDKSEPASGYHKGLVDPSHGHQGKESGPGSDYHAKGQPDSRYGQGQDDPSSGYHSKKVGGAPDHHPKGKADPHHGKGSSPSAGYHGQESDPSSAYRSRGPADVKSAQGPTDPSSYHDEVTDPDSDYHTKGKVHPRPGKGQVDPSSSGYHGKVADPSDYRATHKVDSHHGIRQVNPSSGYDSKDSDPSSVSKHQADHHHSKGKSDSSGPHGKDKVDPAPGDRPSGKAAPSSGHYGKHKNKTSGAKGGLSDKSWQDGMPNALNSTKEGDDPLTLETNGGSEANGLEQGPSDYYKSSIDDQDAIQGEDGGDDSGPPKDSLVSTGSDDPKDSNGAFAPNGKKGSKGGSNSYSLKDPTDQSNPTSGRKDGYIQ